MGSLFIVLGIVLLSALAVMSSGYRMDKYLKPLRFFRYKKITGKLKKILFIKTAEKETFLNYGIFLYFYAYITIFSSIILSVIATIVNNPDFLFITLLIMFSYLVLDTLLLCFEMVMLTIFCKKSIE